MSAPTAVVFDMGGVLVDWNPEYLYRKLIPDDEKRREFLEKIINVQQWQGKLDAGVPFDVVAAEALERFAGHPEMQNLIRAWDRRFGEMFHGPIQGTVDILADLRARNVPLFGLTNWSEASFRREGPQFAFLKWFKDIVVSGTEKVKKPDPAIYQILLARTGLPSEQLLFIDDREENLVPARALGIQCIWFQSPDQLRSQLQQFRL